MTGAAADPPAGDRPAAETGARAASPSDERIMDVAAGRCTCRVDPSFAPVMHDLLRLYAGERARAAGAAYTAAAVDRLDAFYLEATGAAADVLYPSSPLLTTARSGTFTYDCAAGAWLDAERPTLVATVVDRGRDISLQGYKVGLIQKLPRQEKATLAALVGMPGER